MTCALALTALLAARASVPFEAEIDAALNETAAIYPVPKALVIAVISVESGFRPRAASRAGAKGLMQLMPYTARRVGVAERNLFDPAKNILGGVRLLAVLLRHYDGDVISALVAYNARPRRLLAPIPRNGETPTYVWRILARARAFGAVGTAPLNEGAASALPSAVAPLARGASGNGAACGPSLLPTSPLRRAVYFISGCTCRRSFHSLHSSSSSESTSPTPLQEFPFFMYRARTL
jgi:soluble lytic murein transglycosylase-like protein